MLALTTTFSPRQASAQDTLQLTTEAEPPWYTGLPIADVTLQAPRGGLPEESLEPLLRARQGEPIASSLMRLDIATLFRVGEFAGVEADLQPWVIYDDAGELQQAVQLTYLVYPAARVERVHVQGNSWMSEKELRKAARIEPGSAFYPELDGPAAQARVFELLQRSGFPDAVVEVDPVDLGDGTIEVWLRLAEGRPRLIESVEFTGNVPIDAARLRRWAKKGGIEVGKPLSPDAVQIAQYELRTRLAAGGRNPWSLTRAWFRRSEVGWVTARIGAGVSETDSGQYAVTYTIDPGPLLVLEVDGLTWRGPQKTAAALNIDERLRLTRGFLESAPERMTRDLQRRGYLEAQASVVLAEADDQHTLSVDVSKGARHVLRSRLFAPPDSELHGIVFDNNTVFPDWQLRTVAGQASYDVIRNGRLTGEELDKGLDAVRELYQASGYPDVQITHGELVTRERPSLIALPGVRDLYESVTASPPSRWVAVRVDIDEGPVSTLAGIHLTGNAEGVDVGFAETLRDELVGQPWSPQRLELLAQSLVEAHRSAGYLEADARVINRPAGELSWASEIRVEPGPQVLLRSVVTRGAQHTRPAFIRNQVDLTLGAPLTSADLDQARNNLYDLGIFGNVRTELLGDEAARDLVIGVEERGRNAVEFGGGLSTDQGVRLFSRYTRRNLFRVAHRIDLNAFAGLQGLTADKLEFRAAGAYTAPHFPARNQQLVLDALLQERLFERTYELARTGTGLFLDTRFGRHTTLRTGTRLELRRIIDVDPGIVIPGEPWEKVLADPDRTWRPAHTIDAIVVHDRRDDPLKPTRGSLLSISSSLSPPNNSDLAVPFARLDVAASALQPIRSGVTLHVSGQAGHAAVLGDGVLALEDRYRVGGTASLRGYRRDAVGPRMETSQVDIDWPSGVGEPVQNYLEDNGTRWVPLGGDTQAVGTAELIVPFPALGLPAWEGYAGSMFVDFGNTWLLGAGEATSDTPEIKAVFDSPVRYGVGAGLRMDTPVGPLQIDLAVNPAAAAARDERYKLLRDQWLEPWWRPHVSLGTLF